MTDVVFPLDFTGGSLPANVALARSSVGSYYNSSGAVASASTNVARFDYDPATLTLRGLLIEPSTINECGKSHDFSAFSLQDATKTDAQSGCPDGSSDGTLLKPAATQWGHYMFSAASGQAPLYTSSVYAKASGYTTAGLNANDTKAHHRCKYDLSGVLAWMGQSVVSARLQQCASSWFRLSLSYYGAQWVNLEMSSWPVGANTNWLGMGVGDTTSGCLFWGQQTEAGDCASPFIPSSYFATAGGANGTRSADVCTFSIGAGIGHLTYTFDDNTTQTVTCSTGAYTIPTTLNRPWIKTIAGSA